MRTRPVAYASLKTIVAVVGVATCLSSAPAKQDFAVRGLGGSVSGFVVVDNCRAFSIVFNAAETATRAQPGGPVNSAFVAVFIDAVDQCALRETFINATGQPVVSGSVQKGVQIVGSVSGSQFDFTTFTSSPISGAVNVTLTPTDQPVLTHSESTFGNAFTFQRMRAVGFAANAIASGSIVLDGVDYLAAALASGSSMFSAINSFNDGSLTIVK